MSHRDKLIEIRRAQRVARLEQKQAKADAGTLKQIERDARTHMLCCIGGDILAVMDTHAFDPMQFVPEDFRSVLNRPVTMETSYVTPADVLKAAWKTQAGNKHPFE